MNEWVWSIGGMILTGETEVLGEKHYTVWVVDEWMSVEHWWNDTDLSHQLYDQHKSFMDRPPIKLRYPQWNASD